jgi:Tfp pilus assembly protein PilX
MTIKQNGNTILFVLTIILIISYLATKLSINISQSSATYSNNKDYQLAKYYNTLAIRAAEKLLETFTCPDQNCKSSFVNNTPQECKKYNDIVQIRSCALRLMYNISFEANNCNINQPWKGFCGRFSNDYLYAESPFIFLDIIAQAKPPCDFYSSNLSYQGKSLINRLDDKNLSSAISYETNDLKLCAQPRYLIEFIDLNFTDNSINPIKNYVLYRITAKSFGINGNISYTKQEYFAVETTSSPVIQRSRVLSYTIY